ncbi:hypothetical protein [Plantibacter sp. YIM 135347]|uniref:hypothetical protein n=1 Tax=Plantibacter sp. YIM 135347 TaxID=3423919 RepID=UPI003D34CAA0
MTAHTSRRTMIALLGASVIAIGLLSSGPAIAEPETASPIGAERASAPFLGANLSTMLTRDKVSNGEGVDYDWDAAARTLDQELGVHVVRAGVYCSDPTIVEEFAAFSPFGCTSEKADDLDVVSRLIAEDGLTVAPIIQINWQSSQGGNGPQFDEALRDDYYAAFGRHIGRSLAAEVASGAVPYFELGNEPDHACIVSGNPWGTEPGHFDSGCLDRVRTSILALQSGIREGVAAAVSLGGAPAGTQPQFAVGVSGIRWGLTDALWNGSPTATNPNPTPVSWDFTVVHWYYQNGYGNAVGAPLDQRYGFDNVFGMDALGVWNAAANYRDRYGKPLVITEFGVFPTGAPGGDDASRASSFTRLLTGLVNLADEYDIAGVYAFTFTGPEGVGNGGSAGDFNLANYDRTTSQYRLSAIGQAYRSFTESPIMLTEPTQPVRLDAPAVGAAIPTPVPVFSGAGSPGSSVEVRGGSRSYCAAEVNRAGVWNCTSTLGALSPGAYLGVVRQTKPGERTTSAPLSYTITR